MKTSPILVTPQMPSALMLSDRRTFLSAGEYLALPPVMAGDPLSRACVKFTVGIDAMGDRRVYLHAIGPGDCSGLTDNVLTTDPGWFSTFCNASFYAIKHGCRTGMTPSDCDNAHAWLARFAEAVEMGVRP